MSDDTDNIHTVTKDHTGLSNVPQRSCSYCRYPVSFISILLILWMSGIVIAKGFWPTVFCITLPPYAIYVFVEHLFRYFNFI